MSDPLLEHFKEQWRFLRGLTNDLLSEIPEAELQNAPESTLSSWWKQFRHVGRVQENYLQAIKSGRVVFNSESGSYQGGPSRASLKNYLSKLDAEMESLITGSKNPTITIDWFGEPKSLSQHLLCLCEHEILHHGQWITYQKLTGRPFPKSWAVWGL